MRKSTILFIILFVTGCSTRIIEGRPLINRHHPKIHKLNPELQKCVRKINLNEIRDKLTAKTNRKFKNPLFTYAVLIKGNYYLRYFFPLENQMKFAGVEVWVNCGDTHTIFYKFLPLE